MRGKKRGISPLIATVLLIGFTIAIIAMLFIWWGDFVKQKAIKEGLKTDAERACLSYVDIDVISAKEESGILKIIINNRGSQKLSGFRFRIENDKGGIATIFKQIDMDAVSQKTIQLDSTNPKEDYGANPTKVEVFPIVVKSSDEGSLAYTCTDKVIKITIE